MNQKETVTPPQIQFRPSVNFDARPSDVAISMIVLHYTELPSTEISLERLSCPKAAVSAHYLVCDSGVIYQLVEDQHRAWHAGISSWAGETALNAVSLGIEIQNQGLPHGRYPYPAPQMEALLWLLKDLSAKHSIAPHRILGHSDIAPMRKKDPGSHFDWALLARHGLGLGHKVTWPLWREGEAVSEEAIPQVLEKIGYSVQGEEKASTAAAIRAFQEHFCPTQCDGMPNLPTRRALFRVLQSL